jgi:hypothetical protein
MLVFSASSMSSSCVLIALAAPLAVKSIEIRTKSTIVFDSLRIMGFDCIRIDIRSEAIE